MAVILETVIQKYIGTNAERLAFNTTNVKAGSIFEESDTSKKYKYNGTTWFETDIASASSTQATHDNLNCNANIQVANTDVGATNPVNICSNSGIVSASHTRPDNTTAYAIGDVVGTDAATNLSWANINSASGKTVIITGVSLEVDVNAVPSGMSSLRLHLYTSAPTAITDNLAFNLPSGDRTKYAGWIDIDTPIDIGDTLFIRMNNVNFQVAPAARTLYGMLETRGAFTPSSQTVKTVTLYAVEV